MTHNSWLNYANKVGRTPLHVAAMANHLDVLKTLVTPGFDWNETTLDSLGCTPLHLAAIHGHLEAVKFLIKENCPINYQNQFGNTALHEASFRGQIKIVKYLIQKKADKSIQNQDGNLGVHLACQSGHLDAIKALLKSGSDPNWKNACGDTCLHICVRYNQFAAYKFLISNSYCKFEETNSEKNTPLHLAVQYNRKEFVTALLEVGVGAAAIKNQQGETALDIANRLGNDDLFPPSSTLFLPSATLPSQKHTDNVNNQNTCSSADQQSKQPSNETSNTGTSSATSGMKNLFRAATGRTSSSGATARNLSSTPTTTRQQLHSVGGENLNAPKDNESTNYETGKNARSRSRGAQPPKTPSSPVRKRDASGGNKAIEHENSPATDLAQELCLEIDDDATKPTTAESSTKQNDDQGIVLDENGELMDNSEFDLLRRHQRRSHKSKGKVPRKYIYDRGVYRRSKRFGNSMSSLSTIDQHHQHNSHSHHHPRGGGGERGDNKEPSSSRPHNHHPHDLPATSSSRHHHHRRRESSGGPPGGGGQYTLYDGAYLTKPAKESPGEQKRRHRVNRNLEAEDFSTDHRGGQSSAAHLMSKCRCGCSKHIAALDAKVEFLKEAILDELKLSEEVTDKKIVDLDEKTTHQVACVDKLCRERISAERTECNHRMDRRALQERIVYSKELRKLELRMENTMKVWCEARYRRVNERIGSQMNFYPTLSSTVSPGGTALGKRRHSCGDVDPRNLSVAAITSQDESGAETTNSSSKSGYRDSGAFESHSKASSQDYPVTTTSGGESLGTTPSETGASLSFAPTRSKNVSGNFVGDSHGFSGFQPIEEKPGVSGRYPNVFHNTSDDAESVIDTESISHLPVLHGLPSDSMKPNDFASLAIPPLLTKDVRVISDNKRSISAHSDQAKMASEEIMTQLQQNYGSIHYKDSSRGCSHGMKSSSYYRAASTSVSGSHNSGAKMSLSPLTAQRSQARFSSVSGAGVTPSYQEVSAQLKAIQQQAARSKVVRNSSLSDERKSHDSSGSANGSLNEGKTGNNNEQMLSFQTPIGSWEDKNTRHLTDLEASMKKHYEKDQQALKQKIRNLEQMLKSYQQPSNGNSESHQKSQIEN
ncbi:uncharacterized protein LOC134852854 isoform X3 [Symsagittifera roscoffensis]|uniref:uncharacterized protein LOC134852854 isoform X3 n=1 Tax=Symsagittifera roscoffensis TaxID=84072 RepID=UPI00307C1283